VEIAGDPELGTMSNGHKTTFMNSLFCGSRLTLLITLGFTTLNIVEAGPGKTHEHFDVPVGQIGGYTVGAEKAVKPE
jgi:hypothetical protein